MKKKKIWVQEKGCGNSFGHKNKPKKIGHWGENKGILTLGHNNDQKKLGPRKKKGGLGGGGRCENI